MVDGIYLLMQSDLDVPVNIGCTQYVTVDELDDVRDWVAATEAITEENFKRAKKTKTTKSDHDLILEKLI